MKLLVVGGGGREHAIAWKLASSSEISLVYVAPGNAGIALEDKVEVRAVAASDFSGLSSLVKKEGIDFVVVGPDQALADGIVDYLEAHGITCFGPTKAAAQLEASKAFAKEVMTSAGIPTAKFQVFSELSLALDFIKRVEWGSGWVVKADGLALGKGVVVCASREEAMAALNDFFSGSMGEAGKKVLIEECLEGPELSAFSLCDGENAVFLGFACDYKRLLAGNEGPNTGGMGAYSPADWMPESLAGTIYSTVVMPLLAEMKRRGIPYKGILFTGLMITKNGPKVLEFNARFGDPETQVLLPMIEEDLLPWLQAARGGKLANFSPDGPKRKSGSALHIVMAAEGYPGLSGKNIRKGDPIEFPSELVATTGDTKKLFFAGVNGTGTQLLTNGGRVLGITAFGKDRNSARLAAYKEQKKIHFQGAQWREDIGV